MRIEQIETNKIYIDYTTLNLTRKVLEKDLKELGMERFLGTYYTKLGFYTKRVCRNYPYLFMESPCI